MSKLPEHSTSLPLPNSTLPLLPEHQHIYSQPVYMQMLQKSLENGPVIQVYDPLRQTRPTFLCSPVKMFVLLIGRLTAAGFITPDAANKGKQNAKKIYQLPKLLTVR